MDIRLPVMIKYTVCLLFAFSNHCFGAYAQQERQCRARLQDQTNRELMQAVIEGKILTAKALVGARADVNAGHMVYYGKQSEQQVYLDGELCARNGCEPKRTDMTPLGCAVYKDDISMMSALLYIGRPDESTVERAFMIAAHHDHSVAVRVLCDHLTQNRSFFCRRASMLQRLNAPLHEAVACGYDSTVKTFLAYGVPLSNQANRHSVFHTAAQEGGADVLQRLLVCELSRASKKKWYQRPLYCRKPIAFESVHGVNLRGETALACAINRVRVEKDPRECKRLRRCIWLLQTQGHNENLLNGNEQKDDAGV